MLRLFPKSRSALIPLLLLSKPDPLRWAPVWERRKKRAEAGRARLLRFFCEVREKKSEGREMKRVKIPVKGENMGRA